MFGLTKKNVFDIPNTPRYCTVCGSSLLLMEEQNGFWEDNGEPKYKRWLQCPNWFGSFGFVRSDLALYYTPFLLNRQGKQFDRVSVASTRYLTCDKTIVY